jgi:hypothetical protein
VEEHNLVGVQQVVAIQDHLNLIQLGVDQEEEEILEVVQEQQVVRMEVEHHHQQIQVVQVVQV